MRRDRRKQRKSLLLSKSFSRVNKMRERKIQQMQHRSLFTSPIGLSAAEVAEEGERETTRWSEPAEQESKK